MNDLSAIGHPILSCEEAGEFERGLFGQNPEQEWAAMQRAGKAIAQAVVQDLREIGGWSRESRLLVLAGKGHNGGDALLAARDIVCERPAATVEVVMPYGVRGLRPLALRAWRDLQHAAPDRVNLRREWGRVDRLDLVLDGLFGFQYRPPLDARCRALLARINAQCVRLRAAVDLPSGWGEADSFQADFTYATGVVKTPLLSLPGAGRIRYLDLGFRAGRLDPASPDRVLTTEVLAPLRMLRPSRADKRDFGHLYCIGGSRSYPGAILMSVLGALRSGTGLVTAFVPASLAGPFAARVPEAMWVGWPETPDGGLAMEGTHLLRERLSRATAMLIGPGLGREPETMAWVEDVVKRVELPRVLDADALQTEIVCASSAPTILTPHQGEFARLDPTGSLRDFALRDAHRITVLKGSATRIACGGTVGHSFFGGPVLARGGSGDVLAGMIGGLLAQAPSEPLQAAVRGVVWHGLAADFLARSHGQVAVQTTQLLECLGEALRSSDC